MKVFCLQRKKCLSQKKISFVLKINYYKNKLLRSINIYNILQFEYFFKYYLLKCFFLRVRTSKIMPLKPNFPR